MLCPGCWGTKKRDRGSCTTCAGAGTVDDVQLSPHFTLSELVRSQTAVRKALSNAPTPAHVAALRRLCLQCLEPVRAQFGALRVNSGLRLPAVNGSLAGSARRSAHELGWAADFVPADQGVSLKRAVDWVVASPLAFDQVIYEGTWVHLARFAPDGKRERKQALMMFPDKAGKSKYAAYDASDARVL